MHGAFTELEMHTSQMWERIQGDLIDSVVSIYLFNVPVIDTLYFVALTTCFVYCTFSKTKTEMHFGMGYLILVNKTKTEMKMVLVC